MSVSTITPVASLPAGEYWVGDLCNVLSDECWKEVCERPIAEDDLDECGDGVFRLSDGRLFGIVSVDGDGRYPTNRGRKVSVDSGTVGCILLSSITPPERGDIGFVQVFGEDSLCYFDEDDRAAVLGPVHVPMPEDEE